MSRSLSSLPSFYSTNTCSSFLLLFLTRGRTALKDSDCERQALAICSSVSNPFFYYSQIQSRLSSALRAVNLSLSGSFYFQAEDIIYLRVWAGDENNPDIFIIYLSVYSSLSLFYSCSHLRLVSISPALTIKSVFSFFVYFDLSASFWSRQLMSSAYSCLIRSLKSSSSLPFLVWSAIFLTIISFFFQRLMHFWESTWLTASVYSSLLQAVCRFLLQSLTWSYNLLFLATILYKSASNESLGIGLGGSTLLLKVNQSRLTIYFKGEEERGCPFSNDININDLLALYLYCFYE